MSPDNKRRYRFNLKLDLRNLNYNSANIFSRPTFEHEEEIEVTAPNQRVAKRRAKAEVVARWGIGRENNLTPVKPSS